MNESKYYELGMEYLLSFDGITQKMIDAQLNEWEHKKPKSLNSLYKAFLEHAKNRRDMPKTIGEDISELKEVLYNFNPNKVLINYHTWQKLFDAIKKSSYKPPGRMVKSNNRSYWVIYCKSIISIANFLSNYKNIQEFDEFVAGFYTNDQSRVALPLLLKQELFGFGFALSCDFLKENGYPEFVKPDTHLNYIARRLRICDKNNDFIIFKEVIKYCKRIEVLPYKVDKLFWLIGSGKFYLYGVKIKSSRTEFTDRIIKANKTIQRGRRKKRGAR